MKSVLGSLLIFASLGFFLLPTAASNNLLPSDVSTAQGVSIAPTPAPPNLASAFSPPPLTLTRGVVVSSLDTPAAAGPEIVWERDRIPCGPDRVAVDIFRPSEPGHYPVVLLLHGTHGPARCEKFYVERAEALARDGFVSLFLRYYDRGRKGRGNRSLWTKTIQDALTYAAKLPWTDPDRMALLGFSQGAFLALNDAPSDPRIRAVVAFYGGLSPGYVPQAQETMPPTLLFHGTADGIVPVRRSVDTLKWLREEGRPADLVIYPGAGHGFLLNNNGGADAKAAEDSWFRTLAFLNFHLRYPAWAPAVEFKASGGSTAETTAPADLATEEEPPEDSGPAPALEAHPEPPKDAPDSHTAFQSLMTQTTLPLLAPNASVPLFAQAPLQTIPYLDAAASKEGSNFALVNPPADQVTAIARSAPLRGWSHYRSAKHSSKRRR